MQDSIKNEVLALIKAIEQERIESHRAPICAPYVQLWNTSTEKQKETLNEALNELYKDKKIDVWRAINDRMIKTL